MSGIPLPTPSPLICGGFPKDSNPKGESESEDSSVFFRDAKLSTLVGYGAAGLVLGGGIGLAALTGLFLGGELEKGSLSNKFKNDSATSANVEKDDVKEKGAMLATGAGIGGFGATGLREIAEAEASTTEGLSSVDTTPAHLQALITEHDTTHGVEPINVVSPSEEPEGEEKGRIVAVGAAVGAGMVGGGVLASGSSRDTVQIPYAFSEDLKGEHTYPKGTKLETAADPSVLSLAPEITSPNLNDHSSSSTSAPNSILASSSLCSFDLDMAHLSSASTISHEIVEDYKQIAATGVVTGIFAGGLLERYKPKESTAAGIPIEEEVRQSEIPSPILQDSHIGRNIALAGAGGAAIGAASAAATTAAVTSTHPLHHDRPLRRPTPPYSDTGLSGSHELTEDEKPSRVYGQKLAVPVAPKGPNKLHRHRTTSESHSSASPASPASPASSASQHVSIASTEDGVTYSPRMHIATRKDSISGRRRLHKSSRSSFDSDARPDTVGLENRSSGEQIWDGSVAHVVNGASNNNRLSTSSHNSSPSVEFKSASGQGPPSNGSPTSSATRNRSASTGSSSSGLFSKLLHRDKKQSSSTSGEERAHVF